jgi:chromosome segregation ATPase
MRDALAENRLALEDLNNDHLQLKAALDTLGPRLDTKIEQVQLALQELSQRQRGELDQVQARLQDQARVIEDLDKEVKTVQAPLTRWTNQMEDFAEQMERNRKTMYDLRELEKQVRQQGKEMAELQRLAAERQRAELREWQDNQTRVDEEQAIHVQQLEAWQQNAKETLKSLEERLEQNRQDVQVRSDEFWQVWTAYMQGHIGLVESIVKQRRKS